MPKAERLRCTFNFASWDAAWLTVKAWDFHEVTVDRMTHHEVSLATGWPALRWFMVFSLSFRSALGCAVTQTVGASPKSARRLDNTKTRPIGRVLWEDDVVIGTQALSSLGRMVTTHERLPSSLVRHAPEVFFALVSVAAVIAMTVLLCLETHAR